jgi:hypothetical protein
MACNVFEDEVVPRLVVDKEIVVSWIVSFSEQFGASQVRRTLRRPVKRMGLSPASLRRGIAPAALHEDDRVVAVLRVTVADPNVPAPNRRAICEGHGRDAVALSMTRWP